MMAWTTLYRHHHHILSAKKSRRATRKAEAHHTLVSFGFSGSPPAINARTL